MNEKLEEIASVLRSIKDDMGVVKRSEEVRSLQSRKEQLSIQQGAISAGFYS